MTAERPLGLGSRAAEAIPSFRPHESGQFSAMLARRHFPHPLAMTNACHVPAGGLLPGMAGVVVALFAVALAAQEPPLHYQHGAEMPPGVIGKKQLERGGPLAGYYQPVEITGPPGLQVAWAINGAFEPPQAAPSKAGLLIGEAYRLRVTNIPRHEGMEVFPTVEVINRLYPPPGQKHRFPITIELGLDDLEHALAGRYVTRVIYLEDPNYAHPHADNKLIGQRYFDALPIEDPLQVADQIGRPMAIVRIGSRLPDDAGPDLKFLYGSPPLTKYAHEVDPIVAPVAPAKYRPSAREELYVPRNNPLRPVPGSPLRPLR